MTYALILLGLLCAAAGSFIDFQNRQRLAQHPEYDEEGLRRRAFLDRHRFLVNSVVLAPVYAYAVNDGEVGKALALMALYAVYSALYFFDNKKKLGGVTTP